MQGPPGVPRLAVARAVAEVGVRGEPRGPVEGLLRPGQFGEELEGGGVAVGGLRHEGGAHQRAVRLVAPGEELLGPQVGAGADRGASAEVGDGAEGVGRAAPVPLAVGDARVPVRDAVDDEHPLLVDGVEQLGQRVGFPPENHPDGPRSRAAQGSFDALGRVGHGHVAGGAALVQQVHLEEVAGAEEVLLMPVEGGGDAGEGVGARIEPVRPLEAVPDALRHDARVPAVALDEAVGTCP